MPSPRRKAQWGHYPPVIPEVQLDDSGITVEYNGNGALEFSTDYGLIDTGAPGDGIIFTGPDSVDGSYEISVDPTYLDANYLRNDGDTGVGDYEFIGTLTNNGYQVWHSNNDGSGSGLDADLLDGYELALDAYTINTVAARNNDGDIKARAFRSIYASQITIPASTADVCFRNNNTSDDYLRFMDRDALTNFVHGGDSYVKAGRTTTQSLATGVHSVFIFSSSYVDRFSEYNSTTGRFTPNHNGFYLFCGSMRFGSASWGVSKVAQMSLYKNGAQHIVGGRNNTSASATLTMSGHVVGIIYLTTSDYVDFRVYHTFGSSLSSYASGTYCWMTIGRVS